MHRNNAILILLVATWLYSVGECGVVQARITSEYKKDDIQELDCNQFIDNDDILRQFPFPLSINPTDDLFDRSIIFMNKSVIHELYIYEEEVVPWSVFCLSNLEMLTIMETPFQDDVIPDALAKLKQLTEISVYGIPIVKITEQLSTLSNLTMLKFQNCSLTSIPNLSRLENLMSLELPKNKLSHIDGIPAVEFLRLEENFFKEIPTTKNKDKLRRLFMTKNPLKSAAPLLSYKNLQSIYLENTTLTSIPANIDRLQNIEELHLTDNQISYLPTNVLNLRHLKEFSIRNNRLSPNDIQAIQKAFNKSHPNLDLYI